MYIHIYIGSGIVTKSSREPQKIQLKTHRRAKHVLPDWAGPRVLLDECICCSVRLSLRDGPWEGRLCLHLFTRVVHLCGHISVHWNTRRYLPSGPNDLACRLTKLLTVGSPTPYSIFSQQAERLHAECFLHAANKYQKKVAT